jgi:outer membrane biosynthesis protein TonB
MRVVRVSTARDSEKGAIVMRRSLYASTAIHAAILLWVAFGDSLFRESDPVPFEITGVTILSTAEFEALTDAVEPTPVAVQTTPPPPRPTPPTEPDPEPVVEAPPPEPDPQPEPTPPGEVTDTIAPPAPLSGAPDLPPDGRPTPRAADRVAPLPSPAPEEDVAVAPEATPEASEPAPTETVTEAQPEAAPEEATTEIVTEAETPSGGPLGPTASIRPPARPARPEPQQAAAPAPEPDPTPEPDPAPEPDPLASAIASAVADAVSTPAQPSGPPLSAGARDGFRVAVSACWNIGSLSTEAQGTTVVVGFDMTPDARPVDGTLRLVSSEGGSAAAAQQAYEAARRAILRCGANGYGLPAESYDHWRQVELVFNPEGMRLR